MREGVEVRRLGLQRLPSSDFPGLNLSNRNIDSCRSKMNSFSAGTINLLSLSRRLLGDLQGLCGVGFDETHMQT